jgi:hypothetical protein
MSGLLLSVSVNAQEPAVISANGDTLFVGKPNPINVLVPGVSPDKIQLQADNGTVQGANGQYFFVPGKAGFANITINNTDKTTTKLGTRQYYCTYAQPELTYFTGNPAKITRIEAQQFRKPFNNNEGVTDRFSLYIVRKELIIFKQSFFGEYSGMAASINEAAARQLAQVQNGDQIEITDVNVNFGQEAGRKLAKPGSFSVTDATTAVFEHEFISAGATDGKKLLEALGRCDKKMSIASTRGDVTTIYQAFMPATGLVKDGSNGIIVDKNSVKDQTSMQSDSSKITTICKLTIGGSGKKQGDVWIALCADCFGEHGQLIGKAPLFWVNAADAKKQLGKVDKQLASRIEQ